MVRLRLTAKSKNYSSREQESQLESEFDKLKSIIGDVWFDGDRNLPQIVGDILTNNQLTIGTIESCSGGFVAHNITSVPGSSRYFYGSLLTYDYDAKTKLADIPSELLYEVGAVSFEVAELMAKNAREKLGVDVCISTTGIAGPSGGTETKPVGLVYIAVAHPQGVEVRECKFRGTRSQVIERTAYTALNMVRKILTKVKEPV